MEPNITIAEKPGPQPLPSIPPSPITEEDLSRPNTWVQHDDFDDHENIQRRKNKGKSKEVVGPYVDFGHSGDTSEDDGAGGTYPPVNEDTETRKIEENLRRWEMVERQRRKAARESMQNPSRSVVGDVARRASLLWSTKSNHPPRTSRSDRSAFGNHAALKSRDSIDIVPLGDIEQSPSITPTGSPRSYNNSMNPFSHPSDRSSLFDYASVQSTVMDGSSNPPTPSKQTEKGELTPHMGRPSLTTPFSPSNPPPPKPLGLPPPRTPPPRMDQPERIASPSLTSREPEEPKETRWWHDWLCGCSEGSDRGGDNQAGKTNPFE